MHLSRRSWLHSTISHKISIKSSVRYLTVVKPREYNNKFKLSFSWKSLVLFSSVGIIASQINKTNNYHSVIADNMNSVSTSSKIGVITGGASGIGKGIAIKCCLEEFDTLIIIDINEEKLKETKNELNTLYPKTNILIFNADITHRENINNIIKTLSIIYNINSITHLFNNAGVLDALSSLIDNNNDNICRLHRQMDINFWSHVYMTMSFLPLLINNRDNKSYIINTASLAAQIQGWKMYGVTKHAIASYTEALYRQLKSNKDTEHINVLCVCPGFVNTNLVENTAHMSNDYDDDIIDIDINKKKIEKLNKIVHTGISTEDVVNQIFDGIKNNLFYISTHKDETYIQSTIRYKGFLNGQFDQPELYSQLKDETKNVLNGS